MGGVSNAIASSAREAGVEIRTNCAVKHIDVYQSKVSGVVLENGEEIRARTIASNVNAYLTFTKLMLDESFQNNEELNVLRHHVSQTNFTSGTTKINLALSGLP